MAGRRGPRHKGAEGIKRHGFTQQIAKLVSIKIVNEDRTAIDAMLGNMKRGSRKDGVCRKIGVGWQFTQSADQGDGGKPSPENPVS